MGKQTQQIKGKEYRWEGKKRNMQEIEGKEIFTEDRRDKLKTRSTYDGRPEVTTTTTTTTTSKMQITTINNTPRYVIFSLLT